MEVAPNSLTRDSLQSMYFANSNASQLMLFRIQNTGDVVCYDGAAVSTGYWYNCLQDLQMQMCCECIVIEQGVSTISYDIAMPWITLATN